MPEYRKIIDLLYEPKGVHDSSKAYKIKDTVTSVDASMVYFALQDVPAGISLSNTDYWIKQIDLSASKNAMDNATANAKSQTEAAVNSANTRVNDMMRTVTDAVNGITDDTAKITMRTKGETEVVKGNPIQISPDGGSLLKVQTDIPIKQLGSGDPYPAGGGKNLCDASFESTDNVNGLNITRTANGNYILNGVCSSNGVRVVSTLTLEPETYTLSFTEISGSVSNRGEKFAVAQLWDNAANVALVSLREDLKSVSYTLTEKKEVYIRLYTAAGKTYSDWEIGIQLEEGSTATEYAPPSNIRPFIGWDALKLNHAGKNLFNYKTATVSQGVFDENGRFTNTLGEAAGTEQYNYGFQEWNGRSGLIAHNVIMWESGRTKYTRTITVQPGTTTFCLRLFGLRECAIWIENLGIPAGTKLTLSFDMLDDTPGKQVLDNIQIEFGGSATEYVPGHFAPHTVQLGKTTYQGRYDWFAGKFRAEWTTDVLDGSEEWIDSAALGLKVIFTPDSEVPAIGVNAVAYMSHFKRSNTLNLEAMQLNEFTFANRNMSDSSTLSVRTDMSVDEFKVYLASQKAAGTPVQFMRRLATPIEIQLAPNVITAVEDGGVNHIYGDGEIEIEYVKPLAESIRERTDILLNAFSEPFEASGEIVQCEPIADWPFESVVTEFSPKQEGSGDPYPAGGGMNMYNNVYESGKWYLNSVYAKLPFACKPGVAYSWSLKGNGFAGTGAYALFTDQLNFDGGNYDGGLRQWIGLGGVDAANAEFGTFTAPASGVFYLGILASQGNKCLELLQNLMLVESAYTAETMPVWQPYSNIRPISGYDKLELNHAGKNLVEKVVYGYIAAGSTEPNFNLDNDSVSAVIRVVKGQRYKISCAVPLDRLTVAKTETTEFAAQQKLTNAKDFPISELAFTAEFTGVAVVYLKSSKDESVKDSLQIELGSVASPYESYQGNTYTVQIGQTVYGGKFDWLTGRFRAEWGLYAVTGTEKLGTFPDSLGTCNRFRIDLPETLMDSTEMKCSHFKQGVREEWAYSDADLDSYFGEYCITSGYIRVLLPVKTQSEAQAYLAALYAAGTPVQFAWKLATPITIQLDPTEILALPGVNTLYGDGDTITAKFRQLKIISLEERLSALEAVFLNQ